MSLAANGAAELAAEVAAEADETEVEAENSMDAEIEMAIESQPSAAGVVTLPSPSDPTAPLEVLLDVLGVLAVERVQGFEVLKNDLCLLSAQEFNR